ncbi:Metallo-dependent phosphatase-like protein [Amylocystis lapponica]|nr:Metallo-dependent phosphatase-like protein [Amylocystis lapponica]
MFELKLFALLMLSCSPWVLSMPTQFPMAIPAQRVPRTLQGRFLHITDMHPDPHYKVDMSETSACHRRKPKKAKERSGYYGMAYSKCDSPLTLTNYTLDFLEEEWSAEIDFVIWTGDNARHDIDRKLPRTTSEIYALNSAMAMKMEDVFLSKGIPVIPSIGNNDVWPHNIMMPGPNSVTNEFSSIWRSFIPFESYQVFQRGGYYSVEVIPGSLAVISLNTMYFYDANKAVGGCEYTDPEDPGNLQFDWLEVQLEIFRGRGIQVWLSGHVPPSSENFFPECYVRYVELSLRYQDTIVGHLFGHMNTDHFFFLDAEAITVPNLLVANSDNEAEFLKHKELYKSLLKDFAALPNDSHNISYDNYGVVNVAPSVVPNPYLPSFRIFTYNTTGEPYKPHLADADARSGHERRHRNNSMNSACARPEDRDTWNCQLSQPWHSHASSPSRTNMLWSPLGYAQFYLPALNSTGATKKHPPKYKLEYLTHPLSLVYPPISEAEPTFHYPIPLRHLPRSLRKGPVSESKYAPYGLADLTIPSWTELAQRLAQGGEKKLRRRFRKYMYMGADEA